MHSTHLLSFRSPRPAPCQWSGDHSLRPVRLRGPEPGPRGSRTQADFPGMLEAAGLPAKLQPDTLSSALLISGWHLLRLLLHPAPYPLGVPASYRVQIHNHWEDTLAPGNPAAGGCCRNRETPSWCLRLPVPLPWQSWEAELVPAARRWCLEAPYTSPDRQASSMGRRLPRGFPQAEWE